MMDNLTPSQSEEMYVVIQNLWRHLDNTNENYVGRKVIHYLSLISFS